MDSSGSGQGKVAGYCVHGTELLVSTKSVEFIHQNKNYYLFERELDGQSVMFDYESAQQDGTL